MAFASPKEAQEAIMQWLNENTHNIKIIEDPSSSFHFEIDYPLGTMKRQRVIQPKEYPGLCVLLNGVAIADEHLEKMKEMNEDDREKFYAEIRRDLIFLENSYDMNTDEQGIVKQVQFSYEFYFDSLTKTQLFKGLLLNHRTLLYIINVFNEKFGVPVMPTQEKAAPPAQPVQ